MIIFALLMIILAILVALAAFTLSIGGIAFILVFGDVIVFVMILVWMFRHVFKKKR